MKIISQNRKARHNYQIHSTLEAGLVLTGTEVKSLRQGSANLKEGYAMIENNEVYLYSMHIAPYDHGNRANHEPLRTRKLLLKSVEIRKLKARLDEQGFSLIPLKIYFNERGKAKIELAVAKGKKKFDKRDTIDRNQARKELRRVKQQNRRQK